MANARLSGFAQFSFLTDDHLAFCHRVISIDAGDLRLSAHGDQSTSCASGNVHVPIRVLRDDS